MLPKLNKSHIISSSVHDLILLDKNTSQKKIEKKVQKLSLAKLRKALAMPAYCYMPHVRPSLIRAYIARYKEYEEKGEGEFAPAHIREDQARFLFSDHGDFRRFQMIWRGMFQRYRKGYVGRNSKEGVNEQEVAEVNA